MAITDTMKPALKSMIEAEFQRVGYDPNAASKASRAVKGEGAAQSSTGGVIPRVDLNSALDKNILTELTSTEGKNSWQVSHYFIVKYFITSPFFMFVIYQNRKVAIEAIIQVCERSGHFIEFNATSREIVKALKDRLNDTQANLKPLGAVAIGHLLSSFDTDNVCKVLRAVVGDPLVAGVSDNKKVMRDACISSLQVIYQQNYRIIRLILKQMIVTLGKGENTPLDPAVLIALLPSLSEAALNPIGRLELLSWLYNQLETPSLVLRYDWTELLRALVVAMQVCH